MGEVVPIDARQALLQGWESDGYGEYTLNDFLNLPIREPEALVEGLIPAGTTTMLAGQHKVGKTVMMTQLAMAVAGGIPWIGFPTTPVKVLYLNYEVAPWSFRKRLVKQLHGLKNHQRVTDKAERRIRANLKVQSLPDYRLNRQSDLVALGQLAQDQQIGLIVVDPLRNAFHGDRNKDEVVDLVLNNLLAHVVKPSGAALVLGHHMRKPPPGESGSGSTWELKGSSAFSDAADQIITMRSDRSDRRTVYVNFTLRHYEPPDELTVTMQPASLVFTQGQQAHRDHDQLTKGEAPDIF